MFRRTRIVILTLLLLAGTTAAVDNTRAHDAAQRAQWVAANASPIRSIDPDDTDFRDLQFLKQTLQGVRIVLMGDQTHGDGATLYARSRLVRFLHSEMGFDVLAWESGFFLCEELNDALRSDIPLPDAVRQALHPLMARSGQLQPLFRYIRTTFRTARPLLQTGVDIQDFIGDGRDFPAGVRKLFARLESVHPDVSTARERELLQQIVEAAGRGLTASPEQRRERQAAIASVRARLADAAVARPNVSRTVMLLDRALDNLASLDESAAIGSAANRTDWSLYRDRKMGDTLLWLADRYYRGRKIIVLIGGGHAAHGIGQLYAEAENAAFTDYRTMGDLAHEQLGREVYSIQFAAYRGTYGTPGQLPKPLFPPRAGSIEDLWHRSGQPYGFLDLRSVPAAHWLRSPTFARPFGYFEQESIWHTHFDGLLYTGGMFPSTGDGAVPDGVKSTSSPR